MKLLAILAALALSGCANTPGNITPEAADKNLIICGSVNGIWGQGGTLYLNPKAVAGLNGTASGKATKDGCEVKFTSTGIEPEAAPVPKAGP